MALSYLFLCISVFNRLLITFISVYVFITPLTSWCICLYIISSFLTVHVYVFKCKLLWFSLVHHYLLITTQRYIALTLSSSSLSLEMYTLFFPSFLLLSVIRSTQIHRIHFLFLFLNCVCLSVYMYTSFFFLSLVSLSVVMSTDKTDSLSLPLSQLCVSVSLDIYFFSSCLCLLLGAHGGITHSSMIQNLNPFTNASDIQRVPGRFENPPHLSLYNYLPVILKPQ